MKNKMALKKEKIKQSSLNFDKALFVKNLKILLSANKIKNTDLAKCLGVSSQTISNWVTNDGNNLPHGVEVSYKLVMFLSQAIENFNIDMLIK